VEFLHYVPNLIRLKCYRSLLTFHTVFRIAERCGPTRSGDGPLRGYLCLNQPVELNNATMDWMKDRRAGAAATPA
jgi:hypothetical protein